MSLPRQFGICDTLGCNYELLARSHYRVFCVEQDPIRDFIPVYKNVYYYCPDCARHFSGFEEESYNISSSLPEVEIKLIIRLIIDELISG